MALRFRRYIKLAPGIRMNFSGSGVSWTFGPRGASVNVGKRGTYLNTGIPGTGIYSRQRLDTSAPSGSTRSTPYTNVAIKVGVTDDGTIYFQDADGNPLSEKLIGAAKRQQGEAIRGLIQNKCNEINEQIEALGEIHLDTPIPFFKPKYEPREFQEPEPSSPIHEKLGFLDKIFKSRRDAVEIKNAEMDRLFEEATKKWHEEKTKFDEAERIRKDMIERGIYSDPTVMENFLDEILQCIDWPRETNISAEVVEGGRIAFLDVDLPEIEDIPNKTAAMPQRGYKLSVKEMSPTQIQKLYMRHVHGVGFRIIGVTFSALPTVQDVVLSAYSQRPERATGFIKDEYLYSVWVKREPWSSINFDNLQNIDAIDALSKFDLRREMSKVGYFKPIIPFSPNSEYLKISQ